MAIIKPFRGLRYNQEIVADMSSVVTPPYDVISPDGQERYYQLHPNNIIRLDFGKDISEDTEKTNKYTRAAEFLGNWRKQGILKHARQTLVPFLPFFLTKIMRSIAIYQRWLSQNQR